MAQLILKSERVISTEAQVREEHRMDHKTVEKLESKIEEAIAQVFVSIGRKKLPLVPERPTTHLMAKAAVAVYEAVVENLQERVEE